MNGWMDLQVNLSEPVAAHLVYMNLNSHGHSFNIQCDTSILLKGIENCKSRVVATLAMHKAISLALLGVTNECAHKGLGRELAAQVVRNMDLQPKTRRRDTSGLFPLHVSSGVQSSRERVGETL